MSRLGKCNNYSGCLLAYRGEQTEVPDGQAFVCAECGKPLDEVKAPAGRWIIYGVIGIIAVGLIAGVAVALPKMKESLSKKKTPATQATPQPAAGSSLPSAATDVAPPENPNKKGDAEPPPVVVAEQRINLNVDPTVKAEVLKRIDLMPGLTPTEKDKLYNSVERARSMGKVLTIPFGSGATSVSPGNALELKKILESNDVMKLRDDPTAVFVILGFADPKGDAAKNIAISQARADAVLATMKDKGGVSNVMHAVAMGGSKLLDERALEKNRVVEVWVVLP